MLPSGWKWRRFEEKTEQQRKGGANSGAHTLRMMGEIPSRLGGLQTFRECSALRIFLILMWGTRGDKMGEEEAGDAKN